MNHTDPRTPALRVVLIDDTPDLRLLLRMALEAAGRFRVVAEAGDGAAGVEEVARARPDVVLVDLAMPVLDGLDATRMIRGMAEKCGVVIIAFTALHSSGSRESALAAGCDDYAQKPLGLGQLSNLLNRHLQGSIQ